MSQIEMCPVSRSLAAAILLNRIRVRETLVNRLQDQYDSRLSARIAAEKIGEEAWVVDALKSLETSAFDRLENAKKDLDALRSVP